MKILEFVARMWQYMELLDPEPDGPLAQEIRPNHFYDESIGIPLSGFAILGPAQYVKSLLEGKKLNQGERDKAAENAKKFRVAKGTKQIVSTLFLHEYRPYYTRTKTNLLHL